MNFKEAYKLPLVNLMGIVFTADGNRAFDFPMEILYPNGVKFTNSVEDKIVAIINGDDLKIDADLKLEYVPDETMIYTSINGEKQEFISIRGWGHLTGSGVSALKLPIEVATKIQDEFASYIIDRLHSAYRLKVSA